MKKIFNYFLIGILAFIPIVVILQIVLFVKQMMTDIFSMISGYADNNLVTVLFLAVSFGSLAIIIIIVVASLRQRSRARSQYQYQFR